MEFEDVRNGNNFLFNLRDSTNCEASIPKIVAHSSLPLGDFFHVRI